VDDTSLPKKFLRPASRDRPPISGAFDDGSRPNSAHRSDRSDLGLETIGEPSHNKFESSPRKSKKQRRSSLSDLKSLMAAASLEDQPLQPLQVTKQTSDKLNSSMPKAAASPSKIPISPHAAQTLRLAQQKENMADPFTNGISGEPMKQDSPVKGHKHSKTFSTSNIPTLKPSRPGTSGADSPTRLTTTTTTTTSPTRTGTQKLRLQSPQKLRERLQTEKKGADEVDASLRTELSKIGEEMARVNNASPSGSHIVDLSQLAQSVKSLEDQLPSSLREVQDKQAALQRDMDATVKASEAKVRAIDQLYKEATAENELLYERFNGELGKIVKALRGRGKEDKEELMAKLKEQGDETARLKKENHRLKREMVSLRAALKGTE
jgi:hypothetical protein